MILKMIYSITLAKTSEGTADAQWHSIHIYAPVSKMNNVANMFHLVEAMWNGIKSVGHVTWYTRSYVHFLKRYSVYTQHTLAFHMLTPTVRGFFSFVLF